MSGIRYNLTIDSIIAAKFAEWQAIRGGVICWVNQEIGGNAALEIFTPRITSTQIDLAALSENEVSKYRPNWRYGNPALVDFASLRVECFTLVRSYRAKCKRLHGRIVLTQASERKAEKEAESIGGTYRWQHADVSGQLLADVELGHIGVMPFDAWLRDHAGQVIGEYRIPVK